MNDHPLSHSPRRIGRRTLLRLGTAAVAVAALDACSAASTATSTASTAPTAPATAANSAVAATAGGTVAATQATAGTATMSASGAPAAAAGNRPNIVFINTDDLDMASLPTMPKLKALLADQGTTCTNFFVNVSLCCPSRSTFLRGQYASHTQVLTNGGDNGGYARAHAVGIENSTVATWLQAAGYRTALVGKYLNGYGAPESGAPDTYVPPGWSEWYGATGGVAYFDYALNENGKIVKYGNGPQDYQTDVLSGKAADFITRAAANPAPFFLYIAPKAPHGPATPAPKYANAFPDAKAPRPPSFNEQDVSDKPQWVQRLPLLSDKEQAAIDADYRRRIQTMQSVDDLIENVVNTLQATGRLANTYIVFSSDNGFMLGEHRDPSGKQVPYEESFRLPLIVRGPGIAAGGTMDQLVGNVDFAPTFAEWAGASVPDFVDGRSFAPLLAGKTPDAWRQAFLIEHFQTNGQANGGKKGKKGKKAAQEMTAELFAAPATPGATSSATAGKGKGAKATSAAGATATPGTKAGNAGRNLPEFHGMRTKEYVYIEYATNERELYDLTKDGYEVQNIAGSADPALLSQLSARLADVRKGAGAAMRAAEQQPVPVLH